MTNQPDQGNFFQRLANNQKLIAGGGLFMFFLGLIAWFMAMATSGVTEERITATLSSVILLAMGYPMMLYVGVQKKLNKAEDRIKQLEGFVANSNQPSPSEPTR